MLPLHLTVVAAFVVIYNVCFQDVAPSLFINFAKLYPESLDHALSLKVPALEAGKRSKHHVRFV